MSGKMRTTPDGPVVVSVKTFGALLAIRREKLLESMYGSVVMPRSGYDGLHDKLAASGCPAWLDVKDDLPQVQLPPRLVAVGGHDGASLQLALGIGASLVLIEEPVKEKAKLSFIKAEGTVSILVMAYRLGLLTAVPPMVKALEKLGYRDVLPPSDQLKVLWVALDAMG